MRKIIVFILTAILTIAAFSEKAGREADEYTKIRVKWAEFLTGVSEKDDVSSKEIKQVIGMNERYADKFYVKMNKEKNKKYFLKGSEDTKSGIQIMENYSAIKNVAKGYATKGTKFYKNEEVKNTLIGGLDWLHENAYHEGLPELGNWWHWEIGIPKAINDIIILMYDDIPEEKRIKYLKASEFFQPDARHSGAGPTASYSSTPDKRVSTGGNRTDTAMISFMRGIILKDEAQVKDALNAVSDVGEYAVKGDGFYKDGSFIQHDNVAYNGTYASVLFNGLGGMLYLVKDTSFELKSEKIDNVYDAILNGYDYLFINGGVNDSVSGRAISRNNSSDLERGRGTISALAMLSEGAPEKYKKRIQELIKTTIKSNNSFDVVKKTSNRTIKNILKNIMDSRDIKIIKKIGNKLFHSMDRAVSKNENGGAVVVSMHSSRIANFETMNGENLKGWFTGDGLTYIYGNDSEAFTEFWPTVDLYHLPGVTNSLKVRGDRSGERRGIPSPNPWTGGVENGREVFAGMDMLSWNKEMKVKKVYLMTEEGTVFVGGYNLTGHEGEVHTTIDNRILKSGKVFVNGKEIKRNAVINNPKNVCINFSGNYPEENISYKIIEAPQVVIKFEERKGNWKHIGGTDEKEITKKYAVIYINHGKNPKDAEFSYVIMPMFSMEDAAKYDVSKFEIKEMNDKVFAMKDESRNITRVHFWQDLPEKFEKIKSFSASSVIFEENLKEGTAVFSVSDPTQLSKYSSVFEIDGDYVLEESTAENAEVKNLNNKTKIKINLRNNGATEVLKLRKK